MNILADADDDDIRRIISTTVSYWAGKGKIAIDEALEIISSLKKD
jgi:hypothetical protein